ncbi:DUF1206 domain containing protein [Sulfitobacter guttiformis KCTC 32187]|nr:DUF1206 domain containing protein [Sulfitobacter guttiformis KCTC 32187]
MPIMRAGYGGRGIVYLVVAGVSLWSVWHGGEAEGAESAMRSMDGLIGMFIVSIIAAGMFAYAIWRCIDSFWDLEAFGTSARGIFARTAMVITGLLHSVIGVLAVAALGYRNSGDGGRSLLAAVMQTPLGPWIIGSAGVATVGAGLYYINKGFSQSYRDDLQANHFTLHWNPLLRAGLCAQGISILIVGALIVYAAATVDASKAGGLGSAFDWLHDQSFGTPLVIVLCLGLLCFSLFCFVNAAFRIIPKASDKSVKNLASQISM